VPVAIDPSVVARGDRPALEIAAAELYEWLSLVRLGSPRVSITDDIDPYLSRYRAPNESQGSMLVCHIRWQGLMSTAWLEMLLVDILASLPSRSWFSLSATEISDSISGASNEVALLRPGKTPDEYLMWQIGTKA
jgi:ribonucleases P/MRP protein subunit RPP40